MMPYVNPEAMTAVGSKTKQTVIYKSESHKLHQAFPVKKDEVILQGQPVQLNTDGTIQAYFGTGIIWVLLLLILNTLLILLGKKFLK